METFTQMDNGNAFLDWKTIWNEFASATGADKANRGVWILNHLPSWLPNNSRYHQDIAVIKAIQDYFVRRGQLASFSEPEVQPLLAKLAWYKTFIPVNEAEDPERLFGAAVGLLGYILPNARLIFRPNA